MRLTTSSTSWKGSCARRRKRMPSSTFSIMVPTTARMVQEECGMYFGDILWMKEGRHGNASAAASNHRSWMKLNVLKGTSLGPMHWKFSLYTGSSKLPSRGNITEIIFYITYSSPTWLTQEEAPSHFDHFCATQPFHALQTRLRLHDLHVEFGCTSLIWWRKSPHPLWPFRTDKRISWNAR